MQISISNDAEELTPDAENTLLEMSAWNPPTLYPNSTKPAAMPRISPVVPSSSLLGFKSARSMTYFLSYPSE
ncbi:hypothetical protein D1872_323120 [compost metagenome]